MAQRPEGVKGNVTNLSTARLFMDDENYPLLAPLDGHKMETDDIEETDAVDYSTVIWDREALKFNPHTVRVINPVVDGVTATITVPAYEYSRLQELIEGGDERTFISIRQGSSYSNRFAKIMRSDAALTQLNDADPWSISSFNDIDEPEGPQTTVSASNLGKIYPMNAAEVNTIGSTALYDVLFTFQDTGFVQSGFTPKDILVVGADTDAYLSVGSSSGDSYETRWDTITEITNAIGSGNIITSIVQDGGTIVGTWADNIAPASATDGGTFAYVNSTVTIGTTITNGMYGSAAIDGTFYFVGAGGVIRTSNNLDPAVTTAITHSETVEDMTAIDADVDNNVLYIVTDSGSLLTLVASNVTDISAYIPGSPSSLSCVKVLGDDHVAIGGASGYFAEHRVGTRASASNQYTQTTLNSGSGTCRSIGGNDLRVMAAVDTKLFERSPLTINDVRLEFAELELDGGAPSGNIMAIEMLTRYNEMNFGVAVTASAEIIYLNPELAYI
jgi:hypothetical protein